MKKEKKVRKHLFESDIKVLLEIKGLSENPYIPLNGVTPLTYRPRITLDQWEAILDARANQTEKKPKVKINVKTKTAEPEQKVKAGKEERKPKMEDLGDSYKVYYGPAGDRKSVVILKSKLQDLLDLYCVAQLSINSCTYRIGLTRREFFAIKTALDITKDSIPIINDDLDKMNTEEIAEAIRLKKKRYALKKFEDEKHKDQSKEIDKFNRSDYWHSKLISGLDKIDPTPFPYRPTMLDTENKLVFFVADVHAGLRIDAPWNTYDLDVMERRFQKLTNEIISDFEPQRISIADVGDTVHGKIHGSVRKYSDDMITSAHRVAECYGKMFLSLIDAGFHIEFSKVNGSHESIENNKQDRTDEESIGRTIFWALQWKFADIKQVSFIESVNNVALIPVPNGKHIAVAHGDQTSMTNMTNVRALYAHLHIIEVNCGHIHHRKIESFDGITVLYNEAFCGSDQYAISKFLHSPNGVRYARFTSIGRKSEGLIPL